MVAVDEGDVHRREVAEHVDAEGAVEHVPAREALLVLGGVEVGERVDDVELGLGAEAVEHQLGVLAAEGTDLDDAPGAGRLDDRGDDVVPEREHAGSAALSVQCVGKRS